MMGGDIFMDCCYVFNLSVSSQLLINSHMYLQSVELNTGIDDTTGF